MFEDFADSIFYYITRACFALREAVSAGRFAAGGVAATAAGRIAVEGTAATAASLCFLCEYILFCVNIFDNADAETFSVIFNRAA